jgi:hypothetical protein
LERLAGRACCQEWQQGELRGHASMHRLPIVDHYSCPCAAAALLLLLQCPSVPQCLHCSTLPQAPRPRGDDAGAGGPGHQRCVGCAAHHTESPPRWLCALSCRELLPGDAARTAAQVREGVPCAAMPCSRCPGRRIILLLRVVPHTHLHLACRDKPLLAGAPAVPNHVCCAVHVLACPSTPAQLPPCALWPDAGCGSSRTYCGRTAP